LDHPRALVDSIDGEPVLREHPDRVIDGLVRRGRGREDMGLGWLRTYARGCEQRQKQSGSNDHVMSVLWWSSD
jgi:hypothetical protein